jgi:hypothetical protein
MSIENTKVNNTYSVTQRKYGVKNLEDTEIMKIYKEGIRKWITGNNDNKVNRVRKQAKLNGRIVIKCRQRLLIRWLDLKKEAEK